MNAAETRASSAMADWTPLAVVSRSSTTAEIDTFISDVSTTSTNIAIASRRASFGLLPARNDFVGGGLCGHVFFVPIVSAVVPRAWWNAVADRGVSGSPALVGRGTV